MNASTSTSSRSARRRKLVEPRLQLRLVASFAGLALLALLLQFGVLTLQLTRGAAASGPNGAELARQVPEIMLGVLAVSLGLVMPVIFVLGLALTNRFAGPVTRMKAYLADVNRGRETEPMTLRERDDLQDLCELVNEATEERRERNAAALAPGPRERAA